MISKIVLVSSIICLSAMAIAGFFGYVVGLLLLACIFIISFFLPSVGLLLYVASLPLFQFSIPGNLDTSVPAAIGYSFFPGTLFGILHRREVNLYLAPGSLCIVAFLGVVVISTYSNLSYNVPHLRVLVSYVLLGIVYFLVIHIVQSERILWEIVVTLVSVTFLVCLFVVYQYFTGQYKLLSPFAGYEEGRTYGVADPNYTAAFIATILPLMMGLFFYTKKKWLKVVYLIKILFATFAITTTASRGGIIALIVAILIILIGFIPPRKSNYANVGHHLTRPLRLWVTAPATCIIVITIIVLSMKLAPGIFWERTDLLIENIQGGKSSRIEIWQEYLTDWGNSPWIGLGPGYLGIYPKTPSGTP